MSIGKLAAGQQEYYLSAVAKGVEDYYTGHGEEPGRWLGGSAERLGLSGTVEANDLRAVLSGVDPRDETALLRCVRVPGFDATFSAPKSVSLLYALGDGTVPRRVVAAHEAAVDAAVGYLERNAALVRRGHGGLEQIGSSGFVAAAFRHRTSRAGDPQLHTHVLIANAARGVDGRWSALDGRQLYLQQRTAGFVYQAHLRAELTRSLGVSWLPAHNGMADIAGIAAVVLREFSQRRVEIEQRLEETGASSARAAQVATLATRQAKNYDIDPATLAAQWWVRAEVVGFGPEQVAGVLGRRREPANIGITRDRLGRELTEHASHFDRRDVIRWLAEHALEGASVADLEDDANSFLRSPTPVALSHGKCGMRYSTQELLGVEQGVLQDAARLRRGGTAIAEPAALERSLAQRPTLSDEQTNLVRTITTSGAGVEVVVGAAGAGKTYALDAARAAWHDSGTRVVGVALAARAAAELQSGSGVPSFTVDALLQHCEHVGPGSGLAENSVLVVDEAAMVGTRKLARLLALTRRAQAKLVLVGDPSQLPEIDAGGTFALLAQRLGATTLTNNLRQQDPVEREAVAQYRARHVAAAIGTLDGHGHVTENGSAEEQRQAIVNDWAAAQQAGHDAVMLAIRRSDVDDLNRRARSLLRATGRLGTTELVVGEQAFAKGDHVIALRNQRYLGLLNGTLGTVTRIGRDNSLSITTAAGQKLVVPIDYLQAGHLAHAYARTIHKAQGMTCDHAFLLGDDRLYHEAGYTGLTRGRHANRVYTVAQPHDQGCNCETERGSGNDLVTALERSAAQQAALELSAEATTPLARMGISR